MNKIKRYNMNYQELEMEEYIKGDWCYYKDAEKLIQENKDLKEIINSALESYNNIGVKK